MKFKNYLESITGVGIYPLTSLVIFFLFFSLLLVWALRVNKQYIGELKQLPFVGNENEQDKTISNV